jgi:hypothetical protein
MTIGSHVLNRAPCAPLVPSDKCADVQSPWNLTLSQFEDEETEVTFLVTAVAMLRTLGAGTLGLLWFNRLP